MLSPAKHSFLMKKLFYLDFQYLIFYRLPGSPAHQQDHGRFRHSRKLIFRSICSVWSRFVSGFGEYILWHYCLWYFLFILLGKLCDLWVRVFLRFFLLTQPFGCGHKGQNERFWRFYCYIRFFVQAFEELSPNPLSIWHIFSNYHKKAFPIFFKTSIVHYSSKISNTPQEQKYYFILISIWYWSLTRLYLIYQIFD